MWSIGETAARLGVAVSTLRYWHERGLVTPAARKSGRRVYGEDELHRLAVAKMLQDTGLLSLDEISTVVSGPSGGVDWRSAVHARLAVVREQQERLARAEEFLTHLLRCPSDDPVARCPHLRRDTQDMLGHGARG
jgi:MerR family transcriptional regulator, copper efflux regulator